MSIVGHLILLIMVLSLALAPVITTAQEQVPALQPITVANVHQLQEIARLGRGLINDVKWSFDGHYLAVASYIGLYLYDTTAWDTPSQTILANGLPIYAVAWHPQNNQLAALDADGKIYLWQVEAGQMTPLPVEQPYELEYQGISFEIGGRWGQIAFRQTDLYIKIMGSRLIEGADFSATDFRPFVWNATTGEFIENYQEINLNVPTIHPNLESRLAIELSEENILFKASITDELLVISPDYQHIIVSPCAWNSDSYAIQTCDHPIQIYDAPTKTLLKVFMPSENALQIVRAMSPNSTWVAMSGCMVGEPIRGRYTCTESGIYLYDLVSEERRVIPQTYSAISTQASFSSDGQYLAISHKTGIDIWDLNTLTLVTTLGGYFEAVDNIVFHPQNSMMAIGHNGGWITLWDESALVTGSPLSRFMGHKPLAFQDDETTLSVGDYGSYTYLWDISNPIHPTLLSPEPISPEQVNSQQYCNITYENSNYICQHSPNNQWKLAIINDLSEEIDNIFVINSVTEERQWLFPPIDAKSRSFSSLAFSADSNLMAIQGSIRNHEGSYQFWLWLFNLADLSLIHTMETPRDFMGLLYFNPDSTLLLGAARSEALNRQIYVWGIPKP